MSMKASTQRLKGAEQGGNEDGHAGSGTNMASNSLPINPILGRLRLRASFHQKLTRAGGANDCPAGSSIDAETGKLTVK